MPFSTNLAQNLQNELVDEIRLFYPDFAMLQGLSITHSFDGRQCKITIDDKCYTFLYDSTNKAYQNEDFDPAPTVASPTDADFGLDLEQKRAIKIFNKLCMYDALQDYTARDMAWGSLTGIRPTKLAYDMIKNGASLSEIPSLLEREYRVSKAKAAIVSEILTNQQGYFVDPAQYILFYVHIPFCKTICSYCAFTAEPVARSKAIIPSYTAAVVDEIEAARELVAKMGRKVYAAYIGGGTPTSIPFDELAKILAAVGDLGVEFTAEAGRPDTITPQKLAMMRQYGVTRLCVNPQTLNQKTLDKIGRSHSAEDFFVAYKASKEMGFDINVDLIAGLPDEDFDDFRRSLDGVLALEPDNITVHTLSIKNGAELKLANYDHASGSSTQRMTDYALHSLRQRDYHPYYLYRQKNMAENQENIGYAKKGKQCAYNIMSMEEALPVLASGAGAISKILKEGGRIERLPNLRDPRLYVQMADQRLTKKASFFL